MDACEVGDLSSTHAQRSLRSRRMHVQMSVKILFQKLLWPRVEKMFRNNHHHHLSVFDQFRYRLVISSYTHPSVIDPHPKAEECSILLTNYRLSPARFGTFKPGATYSPKTNERQFRIPSRGFLYEDGAGVFRPLPHSGAPVQSGKRIGYQVSSAPRAAPRLLPAAANAKERFWWGLL